MVLKSKPILLKERIVVLHITSWVYTASIGAEHYYGKLHGHVVGEKKDVELKRTMNAAESRRLNAKDGFRSYRAGSETERFDTREEIENLAVKVWREIFPDSVALVEGQTASAQPQRPLDGDPAIVRRLKRLWMVVERCDGDWDKHPKAMRKCSDEYWKWVCQPAS